MNRAAAEARGRKAERRAAWWLRLHGWRIIGERLRVPAGEVDLVARRGRTIAFIEVKWRDRPADLDLAIDQYRLRRVAAAAGMLAPRFARPHDDIRIDVMLLAPWRLPRHLVHVWQP
ncbi:MAG: YraN family protein [Sphingopyxis sp.]|uniref:YraN family protein n=1 Tax=Sphingopyxis sp. TaxID=1908224 RepID=UPI001A20F3F0|nr:YraN family protein [Sphingopyxis sp.]MBJ7500465.1 YraN family protein [Sphingopyxis sp.]